MADSDLLDCDPSSNNVDEMSNTLNRMKFNIEIYNSIGLKDEFKRLDRELDTFVFDRKVSSDVLCVYLEGLLILERAMNDFLFGERKNPKAPEMTAKEVLTLCSLPKRVIKKYNKYRDLITSQFGDVNPTTVYQLDDGCYNGDKADAKVLCEGQERLERLRQAEALRKPDKKISSLMSLCAIALRAKPLSIKGLTKIVQNLLIVLDILTQYPNIVLTNEHDIMFIEKSRSTKGEGYKGRITVHGDLLALVMQICSKFTKFLKSNVPDDVERLKGETIMLVALRNVMDYYFRKTFEFTEATKCDMDCVQKERNFSEAAMALDYFQSNNNSSKAAMDVEGKINLSKAATVSLSIIRRVYDKSQDLYNSMLKLVDQIEFPAVSSQIVSRRPVFPEKCETLMTELVDFAALHGNEDIKSHAVLYQVYHLAVMDDFSKACDLLRNYVQNGVQRMNSQTQLHFNRAVAQLGLCAYRSGLIEEAHGFLSELLCAHGRVEELLLQGAIGRKAPPGAMVVIRELEYPYHKPMDLEHLKDVHIKCCMLLKDPHIVNTTTRTNKVHFVSSRIRTPIDSDGRAICGASWERVCDGKFCGASWERVCDGKICCAAYSMNNDNNNNNINDNDYTGREESLKKLIKRKLMESQGL